ncbi:MAG: right-handed parallel beta-helix repeat-containing protein [Deltaproteobacteria bacterium]|nr:right-handed parallel beta-helix repeat-containing protein [Deltaproteobacteria bacterium]
MQRKIWSLGLLVAAVLLMGSTARADDFYVVAGGGPPTGTKITSVPYIINNPGFYFLAGNLTYSGTTTNAITISADDVTLDLMGFRLTGVSPLVSVNGIYMSGRSNVEIRNGTVRGFGGGGVYEDNSSGNKHRVINVRSTSNLYGILLSGQNHLIKNCSASDNIGNGLFVGSGLITDCVANNNTGGYGIYIYGPGSVLGNTACNNSQYNFRLGHGVATSILVDRNSSFSLGTNYTINSGTTGVVITGNNSGTP